MNKELKETVEKLTSMKVKIAQIELLRILNERGIITLKTRAEFVTIITEGKLEVKEDVAA